jgi:hypothetical protein
MTNSFDGIMNAAPDELYRVYQVTFGAFAEKMASKNRLAIIANDALTNLPRNGDVALCGSASGEVGQKRAKKRPT